MRADALTFPLAAAVAVVVAGAAGAACVQGVEALDTEPEVAASDVTRSAELWANDPLRRTLDLETGEPGILVEDGALRNRNSQLGFGVPNPGFLEVGIQGRETGVLVDLGTDAEVAAALGAESGFVGLTRSGGGRFGYGAADALFDALDRIAAGEDGGDASRVVPVTGHVLVGAVVKEAGSAEAVRDAVVFKMLIVDHDPDRFLALRWTVL